jgi:tetratricopeptide (TPR) repeat protein
MRIAAGVVAVLLCLFLMQAAARFGFSRLLSRYALIANSIPAADQAVRLTPSDPDAHRARAAVWNRLQMPGEAVKSLEAATSLRYRDDYLWLELGKAKEESGDTEGALLAFDQAVRWAPYYAHTQWQRGNLLLRMGRFEEAFAELRKAALANRTYLPNLIDLAWSISREDMKTAEQLIDIQDDRERLALIRFLAGKGKSKEVINQVHLLSTPLSSENKDELVRLLFAAKAFRDAFALWSDAPPPVLFNGGFEEQLLLNDSAFGGWTLSPQQTKNKLSIDVSEKSAGSRSLQINFGGEWIPGTPLLSQTVIVEPNKSYRIFFSVMTRDVVTGGPPAFTVNDASNNELLGKSENLPAETTPWLKLDVEFTTLATSEAAVLRLQRNNCESSPCPIFGVMWLDDIYIEPVNKEEYSPAKVQRRKALPRI